MFVVSYRKMTNITESSSANKLNQLTTSGDGSVDSLLYIQKANLIQRGLLKLSSRTLLSLSLLQAALQPTSMPAPPFYAMSDLIMSFFCLMLMISPLFCTWEVQYLLLIAPCPLAVPHIWKWKGKRIPESAVEPESNSMFVCTNLANKSDSDPDSDLQMTHILSLQLRVDVGKVGEQIFKRRTRMIISSQSDKCLKKMVFLLPWSAVRLVMKM